jgi:hypothetical protein
MPGKSAFWPKKRHSMSSEDDPYHGMEMSDLKKAFEALETTHKTMHAALHSPIDSS